MSPGAVLGAVVAVAALAAGGTVDAGTSSRGERAPADTSAAHYHGPGATSPFHWSPARRSRRLQFTPTDPLATRQWYAVANHAFDAWQAPPPLAPVRVAVIDSGVDLGHPDLVRRIVLAKSFVGGSAQDTRGHGTIVAGVIAAELDNATGIAGLAPGAELIVAKVVGPAGTVSVEAEARAIRWAVDNGARIINISLGGLRDPRDSGRDTYSRREEEAVRYAVRRGVVVVAAVGNGDQAPSTPWNFASYPAALPHVIGVSALTRTGGSPAFSNRDAVYNDVAAPGEDIISTFPRSVTAERPSCGEQGYTPCATDDFRPPEGTSFAAPQVSAVAANLLGVRPHLTGEQVVAIVERTSADASAATGCRDCAVGRDRLTGWGALDGAAAVGSLGGPLPSRDAHEPNDDAGDAAYRLYFSSGEKARFVKASADFWDDQDDVYAVRLRRGERLFVSLVPGVASSFALALWTPEAQSVIDLARQALRVRVSSGPGRRERVSWTAAEDGWHFIQARVTAPNALPIPYRLSVVRTR